MINEQGRFFDMIKRCVAEAAGTPTRDYDAGFVFSSSEQVPHSRERDSLRPFQRKARFTIRGSAPREQGRPRVCPEDARAGFAGFVRFGLARHPGSGLCPDPWKTGLFLLPNGRP